jgi:putative membrane protein
VPRAMRAADAIDFSRFFPAMSRPFLTDEAKRALTGAVETVEARSSAELVIAVRPRSDSYLHADLIVAAAVALAALAFLLFSPWSFALPWFVIDPLVAGLLGGLLAARSPALRRALTPAAERRRRVETAARAAFVEKGIHRTARRSGMLLYVSLLERETALVVDVGVEPLAATESWKRAVAEIEAAVRRGAGGAAVAEAVCGLALLLAAALARAADDVNELPDEVAG